MEISYVFNPAKKLDLLAICLQKLDKKKSDFGWAHNKIPTGIFFLSIPVEQLTIGPDKAVQGAIYLG